MWCAYGWCGWLAGWLNTFGVMRRCCCSCYISFRHTNFYGQSIDVITRCSPMLFRDFRCAAVEANTNSRSVGQSVRPCSKCDRGFGRLPLYTRGTIGTYSIVWTVWWLTTTLLCIKWCSTNASKISLLLIIINNNNNKTTLFSVDGRYTVYSRGK